MRFACILPLLLLFAGCSSEVDRLSPALRESAFRAYVQTTVRCERESLTERRRKALAQLSAQFAKFEQQAAGTVAGMDLALAKQKNEAKLAEGNRWSCGFYGIPDSELDFKHEKRWLGEAIAETEKLGRTRLDKAPASDWINVRNAAEFRTLAQKINEAFEPPCGYAAGVDKLPATSPARRAYQQLRTKLSGSHYKKHLEVAEADAAYRQLTDSVECSEDETGNAAADIVRSVETAIIKAVDNLAKLANAK